MSGAAFKKGDRVRVEFEATVAGELWCGSIQLDIGNEDVYPAVLPEHLTLLAAPLAVGDIIDSESEEPEPPTGTVVLDKYGSAWQQQLDQGRWFNGQAMPRLNVEELARMRGPLTVIHVGGAE